MMKKKYIKEFKPIEIKEPFKTDIIEFSDPIEFTKYYRDHEEEFANMSTYKLNIRYKIPGYRISQPKERSDDKPREIKLVKDYRQPLSSMSERLKNLEQSERTQPLSTMSEDIYNNEVTTLSLIKKLEDKLNDLEARIINVETYLTNN